MPDPRQSDHSAGLAGDGWRSNPDDASACRADGQDRQGRGIRRDQPLVPLHNPFSVLGAPLSPMRLMFAPLEFALYLPAYAIDSLQGHGRHG